MNANDNKRVALENYVRVNNIDIVCLQETRLRKSFNIGGYQTFFQPAVEGGSRGLAILVHNNIKAKVTKTQKLRTLTDTLSVSLTLKNDTMIITNLYHSVQERSHPAVSKIIKKHPRKHLIVGDFNCHHSAWGWNNEDKPNGVGLLADILDSDGNLSYLNTGEPTRPRSGYSMDLAMATYDISAQADWRVDETLCSDHFATIVTVGEEQITPPPHIPRHNIKKANWTKFNEIFSNTVEAQGHSTYEKFKDAMWSALDAAAPKTKANPKGNKRWWHNTKRSKDAQYRVNRAGNNFKLHRTDYNMYILRQAELQARDIHRQEKTTVFQSWVEEMNAHTSVSELWRKAKILKKGKVVEPLLPNAEEEAEKLAFDFTSRSKRENLPPAQLARLNELSGPRQVIIDAALAKPSPGDLDGPVTSEEVNHHLNHTKNKAPGSDQIPVQALKNLNKDNRKILVSVLNNIFQNSEIPEDWKKGHIIPIPKPGQPNAKRPITLLQTASKLMERVVRDRMIYSMHLSRHIRPSEQFGFRSFRSAQHCYSSMLDSLYLAQQIKADSIVIYLDLEKAFELIDHTVLVSALALRGVQGKILKYIKNYLENRSARVRFQGQYSEYHDLGNGVPQGGILSPTIFNMVIEEIHSIKVEHTEILSYADDLAIIVTKKEGAIDIAQNVLDMVADKCFDLGLKINPNKTKAVRFFYCQPLPNLQLGNDILEWEKEYKYLGVIFDYRLTFVPELKYLISNMSCRTNVLNNITGITWGASQRNLRIFYCNGVRSVVDYAAPALLTILPSANGGAKPGGGVAPLLIALERVQNSALRAIISAPRVTKTTLCRREANICPLLHRIRNIGYKCLTSMASNVDSRFGTNMKNKFQTLSNPGLVIRTKISSRYRNILYHMVANGVRDFTPGKLDPPNPLHKVPVHTYIEREFNKQEISPVILRQCVAGQTERITNEFPNAEHIYTDGSVMPVTGRCGSGVYRVNTGESLKLRVKDKSSTLTTELAAIKLTLETWDESIIIHSDSLGAVQNISNCATTNKLAIEIQDLIIEKANRNVDTILHWIPSHIGIKGNDKADAAAKAATELPLNAPEEEANMPPPRNIARANINMVTLREWDDDEVKDLAKNPTSQSRTWHNRIREILPAVPQNLPKAVRHVATRFRIGHRRWADVIGRADTLEYDKCYCGQRKFTMHHVLVNCPDMDYTHIADLKKEANDGKRSRLKQALEIMRLAAIKNYGPLAAFYFANENMFW